MEEFNRLNNITETYKLRELKEGRYDLINLRRVNSKFGGILIARLLVDNQTKDFYLNSSKANISDEAITVINGGRYKFNYRGLINDKYYDYQLEN